MFGLPASPLPYFAAAVTLMAFIVAGRILWVIWTHQPPFDSVVKEGGYQPTIDPGPVPSVPIRPAPQVEAFDWPFFSPTPQRPFDWRID